MKKIHNPRPSSRETLSGGLYMAFQLTILPSLLRWCNAQLETPVTLGELNFIFYLVNFIAVLLIFHEFLGASLSHALNHLGDLCQAVILGYVAYYACLTAVSWLVTKFYPGFSNYNDNAIAAMGQNNFFLMSVGTVVLVPMVEECFFRGLIFRNLYGKSHWAAYLVSMLAFACIHILGYLGQYTAIELVIALLQYLPAGLWLAWSYIKGGTIFAPILIHTAVNAVAIGLIG